MKILANTLKICFIVIFVSSVSGDLPALAQETRLTLTRAVMCEKIINYLPHNPAVVFSRQLGKVVCYTEFDPVPEQTTIIHSWYHHDTQITSINLTLNPPKWGTYSSIQLREADKGPWRVVVSDANGKVLATLRFSITD